MITADEFVEVANKTYNSGKFKPAKRTWIRFGIPSEYVCCPLSAYAIARGCPENTADIIKWLNDNLFSEQECDDFIDAIDSADVDNSKIYNKEVYDLGKEVKKRLNL